MTVALVFAARSPADPTRGAAGVVTDTRLTIGNGRTVDAFVKAIELSARSVVLVAGESTLPAVAAAEFTRPLNRNIHANIRKSGSSASVLSEAYQYATAKAFVYRSLVKDAARVRVASLVVGPFADDVPGIVRIEISAEGTTVTVFRPEAARPVVVGVGAPASVGHAIESLNVIRPSTAEDGLKVLASIVWEIIEQNRDPGVGGGVLLGYCGPPNEWVWPAVKLAGHTFYRGLPIDGTPADWGPRTEFNAEPIPGLHARVEAALPDIGYRDAAGADPVLTYRKPPGEPGTNFIREPFPDDWTPSPDERKLLGLDEADVDAE